jgi:hypothetical protein
MKRSMAGLVTLMFVALLLWGGTRGRRDAAPPAPPASPPPATTTAVEDAPTRRVRALLEAGRDGDLTAYLDAFRGPLRDRISREADEKGRQAFSADLRAAASSRTGVAVFAAETNGPDSARVVVETIYPDRNERQTYHLARSPDGETTDDWRVVDVELARGSVPAVKVGSYATFDGPDGPPVQVQGGPGNGPSPNGTEAQP